MNPLMSLWATLVLPEKYVSAFPVSQINSLSLELFYFTAAMACELKAKDRTKTNNNLNM